MKSGTVSTNIVILGAGFGGISLANELAHLVKYHSSVAIHLINQENYFLFQPMLPEIVSCAIEPSHILNPIRHLLPKAHIHQATVNSIDFQDQTVKIMGTDTRRLRVIPYDHLVISLGLRMNLATVPGMTEHGLPLKTLGDAFHIRNHVLSRLEEADSEPDPETRKTLLTFVTVGGGFSGVETMAALNDMVKAVISFYPRAKSTGIKMILIHARQTILNELEVGLATFAQKKLLDRGVELRLGIKVKEVTGSSVILANEEKIPASTIICTAGNGPHPLILDLPLPQESGKIAVDATLRVKGTSNIWALGDAALVPDKIRGGWCPPTAQYAMRQGRQGGKNIFAALEGKSLQDFQFKGLGQMAVVGRHCGVAQVWGWKISGIVAWMLWRSVYLMKLPGMRCKIRVALDWLMELIFPRDITKVDVQRTELLKHAHFQKGDIIIREGEIGDRFYIIESGQVEIVHQKTGEPEEKLAIRSAGDSFGELALLKDAPRAATVRCLTSVDVIMFNRKDFLTLVGSYNLFQHHVQQGVSTMMNTTQQHMPTNSSEVEKSIPGL